MDNIITQPLQLEEAGVILGTGKDLSGKNFFNCFKANMEVAQDNKEFDKAPIHHWAAAWRVGNQYDVIEQIKEVKKFVLDIHFETVQGLNLVTCDACKGAGERFKFQKKPIQVGCLKCKDVLISYNGNPLVINGDLITLSDKDVSDNPNFKRFLGRVVEDCISCKGTGRYITEDKEFGGKNDLECKTCHGKNIDGLSDRTQIITKCKTCRGKRTLKIPVISPEIKSTTICRKCTGNGFIIPRPEIQPMNPVISVDIASGIQTL